MDSPLVATKLQDARFMGIGVIRHLHASVSLDMLHILYKEYLFKVASRVVSYGVSIGYLFFSRSGRPHCPVSALTDRSTL